jgi:hypothetical protein
VHVAGARTVVCMEVSLVTRPNVLAVWRRPRQSKLTIVDLDGQGGGGARHNVGGGGDCVALVLVLLYHAAAGRPLLQGAVQISVARAVAARSAAAHPGKRKAGRCGCSLIPTLRRQGMHACALAGTACTLQRFRSRDSPTRAARRLCGAHHERGWPLHPDTSMVTLSFSTPSVSVKATLLVHSAQLVSQSKEHVGSAASREVRRGGRLHAVPTELWTLTNQGGAHGSCRSGAEFVKDQGRPIELPIPFSFTTAISGSTPTQMAPAVAGEGCGTCNQRGSACQVVPRYTGARMLLMQACRCRRRAGWVSDARVEEAANPTFYSHSPGSFSTALTHT